MSQHELGKCTRKAMLRCRIVRSADSVRMVWAAAWVVAARHTQVPYRAPLSGGAVGDRTHSSLGESIGGRWRRPRMPSPCCPPHADGAAARPILGAGPAGESHRPRHARARGGGGLIRCDARVPVGAACQHLPGQGWDKPCVTGGGTFWSLFCFTSAAVRTEPPVRSRADHHPGHQTRKHLRSGHFTSDWHD